MPKPWKPGRAYKTLYALKPRVKIFDDFFVFDTETGFWDGDKIHWKLHGRPEAFIFGVIYGRNFTKVIHDREELIAEFKQPRYDKKYVFAHNAPYDLNTVYGNIYHLDPEAIFNGKFICATNGICKFADSHNIFQTSVKKLGALIGKEKLGMNDGNYKTSVWPKDKARDINGCIRDCEIVWDSLFQIFEFAGDIKITQASLSLIYFKRFHQPYNIEANILVDEFFNSYFGGRCEAFFIGKTNATVIDANSMYPHWMRNGYFPNPKVLRDVTLIKPKDFIKNILNHFEGCIYCTVKHKNTTYGFLPYKEDNKLKFPVGTFTGCWNFPEIRFALEQGAIEIIKITRVVYAPRMETPFKKYVDFLYQKRITSEDEFEKYRIKIFMNSLYGKFAQRIDVEHIYIKDINKQFGVIQEAQKNGTFVKLIPFNEKRQDYYLVTSNSKNQKLGFSQPSFASYITSFARIHLLSKLLSLENCRPVYVDTDSIAFEIDNGTMPNEKQLGGWKREAKIITEIKGLKSYKFYLTDEKNTKTPGKEIWRLKGVPYLSDEEIIFEDETFKKCEQTGANSFRYFNLVNTKEAIRRGLNAGQLIKREKVISGKYDKRIVKKDGTTEPIIL